MIHSNSSHNHNHEHNHSRSCITSVPIFNYLETKEMDEINTSAHTYL